IALASLAACGSLSPASAPAAAAAVDAPDADERHPAPAAAVLDERAIPVLEEAFLSTMTPADNIDSLASWTSPDGAVLVFGTAKATDRLVVYDGATGETLREVGASGTGDGQFRRPNGVAVVDDLLFVVERDNHRVQ